MPDKPPTIDHDPNERHRFRQSVAEGKREPFFGPGLFPLVLTIVIGLLLATYVINPTVRYFGQATCDKWDFCTVKERAVRSAQPAAHSGQ